MVDDLILFVEYCLIPVITIGKWNKNMPKLPPQMFGICTEYTKYNHQSIPTIGENIRRSDTSIKIVGEISTA